MYSFILTSSHKLHNRTVEYNPQYNKLTVHSIHSVIGIGMLGMYLHHGPHRARPLVLARALIKVDRRVRYNGRSHPNGRVINNVFRSLEEVEISTRRVRVVEM
eukprot:3269404-Pyramimonas_sp.AAC.1